MIPFLTFVASVAYLTIGLVFAFVTARRDPKVESPAWALFLCLAFWPLAVPLGIVWGLVVVLDILAKRIGFEEEEVHYW